MPLFKQPSILILDEATSTLDYTTETKIYFNLTSELTDCTLIIIAHRLSSLRGVDRVIVLDEGKIVEAGRFEELSRDPNSRFGKLWRTQQGAN